VEISTACRARSPSPVGSQSVSFRACYNYHSAGAACRLQRHLLVLDAQRGQVLPQGKDAGELKVQWPNRLSFMRCIRILRFVRGAPPLGSQHTRVRRPMMYRCGDVFFVQGKASVGASLAVAVSCMSYQRHRLKAHR
jgi:hypothetical protein